MSLDQNHWGGVKRKREKTGFLSCGVSHACHYAFFQLHVKELKITKNIYMLLIGTKWEISLIYLILTFQRKGANISLENPIFGVRVYAFFPFFGNPPLETYHRQP